MTQNPVILDCGEDLVNLFLSYTRNLRTNGQMTGPRPQNYLAKNATMPVTGRVRSILSGGNVTVNWVQFL